MDVLGLGWLWTGMDCLDVEGQAESFRWTEEEDGPGWGCVDEAPA